MLAADDRSAWMTRRNRQAAMTSSPGNRVGTSCANFVPDEHARSCIVRPELAGNRKEPVDKLLGFLRFLEVSLNPGTGTPFPNEGRLSGRVAKR